MASNQHPIVRARWWIIALVVLLCAGLLPGLAHVEHDDDVLAFLPRDDERVATFHRVATRFGMLEVALVGLEAASGDVFARERVAEIRGLTAALQTVPGVRTVLSFTDLPYPEVHDDGLEVAPLVPKGMEDPKLIAERVLGNPDAVGNVVSRDGKAAALLVFLGERERTPRSEVLLGIREVVGQHWHGAAFFAGAPFTEDAAAVASRTDIERLSPIVIAVLAVASAVMLGGVTAALLNLCLAGLGVGLVMGAHGVFGEPISIVSSTIPVMMVALGGAFGVHVLAGYQRFTGTSEERASAALRELWVPVVLSGVTTAGSFFALLVMPQVPMQRFAVVAGLGVLLLLVLALALLPALLAVLPARVLPAKPERTLPWRATPPAWVLGVLALAGAGLAATLRAEPDTMAMFDAESEPRRANAFFERHFGGSVYVQIAVEADLGEPAVLRMIRDIADDARALEGVADVRTLVEPVAILNEALGGRRGIPETADRARRVLTYLADHPAMAQLMTTDGKAALLHVKLGSLDGATQVVVTDRLRALLRERVPHDALHVAAVTDKSVRARQHDDVRRRLERALGQSIAASAFERALAPANIDDDLRRRVVVLRDRALDSEDSPVEGVPRVEIESIDPDVLWKARGNDLVTLLREHLPTLVRDDAEGIRFVAEHLAPWLDEAVGQWQVARRCRALLASANLNTDSRSAKACGIVGPALAELGDAKWTVAAATPGASLERFVASVTGQPVLGQAFADSVTESLYTSSLVSALALLAMLAVARQVRAFVPAIWTLCVTAGAIAALGHPIGMGTSMVTCIAMGAGVDFAIHLGTRARRLGGVDAGRRATDEIGTVALISALQLGLAFSVLLASQMPPLRQFGAGLALGLLGAGFGAVWFAPLLWRGAERK